MPEGPEVRREADAIARALAGGPLERVEYRVRPLAARAEALRGARVSAVAPRGKAMLIAFDCGLVHLSHHQLYGRWRVSGAGSEPDADRTVRVVLATARRAAVLYSATAIDLVASRDVDAHPMVSALGPDALDPSVTPAAIGARLADPRFARITLGHLLLDQRFCAGLGNYLRSDILHTAGLRAQARPRDLDARTLSRLAAAIVALPRRSYRTRGITNDLRRARALALRGVPRRERRFLVYDREGAPCWTCATPIRREDAAGRGWYYCPNCQPGIRLPRR